MDVRLLKGIVLGVVREGDGHSLMGLTLIQMSLRKYLETPRRECLCRRDFLEWDVMLGLIPSFHPKVLSTLPHTQQQQRIILGIKWV